MKTLIRAQDRSQYYGGGRRSSHDQGSSLSPSSSSSGCFRGSNCRSSAAAGILPTPSPIKSINPDHYQSAGILPTPSPIKSINPDYHQSAGILPTPSPIKSFHPDFHQSVSPTKTPKFVNKGTKTKFPSSSPSITVSSGKDINFCAKTNFPSPELWAGPSYSNSPPPSSLPLPRFSLGLKRSVSLPATSSSDVKIDMIHQFSKSAPPSPTRE
ncbi:hypothetical protein MKW94_006705 [Papaver nudicaule]|uniref:Uncharacterized protein n=1 Tax=Papaver nudicaule TaxID=74823 RepID=A0AA41VD86_PAPNU|nr:hypothetical protein [Papaver nudicaule]